MAACQALTTGIEAREPAAEPAACPYGPGCLENLNYWPGQRVQAVHDRAVNSCTAEPFATDDKLSATGCHR